MPGDRLVKGGRLGDNRESKKEGAGEGKGPSSVEVTGRMSQRRCLACRRVENSDVVDDVDGVNA